MWSLFFFAAPVFAGKVYITRHGEKDCPSCDLNEEGQRRAHGLPNIFNGQPSELHETFEAPKALFAHHYADPNEHQRCFSTIKPLSDATRLPVNFEHGGDAYDEGVGGGNAGAAAAIKQTLKDTGGPVQVAWESINIMYLTTNLTGLDAHNVCWWDWSSSCAFDSVWVLDFNEDGTFASWRKSFENYNLDASECENAVCPDGPWPAATAMLPTSGIAMLV